MKDVRPAGTRARHRTTPFFVFRLWINHFLGMTFIERVIAFSEQSVPVATRFRLAQILHLQGRSNEAVRLLRKALKEYERSMGKGHPQTLNCAWEAQNSTKNRGGQRSKIFQRWEWFLRHGTWRFYWSRARAKTASRSSPKPRRASKVMVLIKKWVGQALLKRAALGYAKVLGAEHPESQRFQRWAKLEVWAKVKVRILGVS